MINKKDRKYFEDSWLVAKVEFPIKDKCPHRFAAPSLKRNIRTNFEQKSNPVRFEDPVDLLINMTQVFRYMT